MQTKEVGLKCHIAEILNPCKIVEMSEVTGIADIENNLVEDDEDGDLDDDRETRAERVHTFFFVELHHFHAYFCLISFVLFLYGFYFGLYDLHASLRDEHFLLRNQQSETDNERDGDDSAPETVSRQ